MPNHLKGLLVLATLFGWLGLGLSTDGISRLRRAGVPPFNEGLFTAVWLVPSPPPEWIQWAASLAGILVSGSLAIAIPVLAAWLLFRRDRPFSASCILCLWALPTGVFGLWTWIFSLFAR